MLDCIIIGSGMAGISAALTLKAQGRSFVLLGAAEQSAKIRKAERIENYPAFLSGSGEELAALLKRQLEESGIEIKTGRAAGVYAGGGKITVQTSRDKWLEAKTAILATGATAAAAVLLFTSLYSATSFFYHLRRGGEIISGYARKKSGWRVRISALLFSFAVMAAAALLLAAYAGGAFFLARLFSGKVLFAANYVLLLSLSFFLVLMLNAYVCPYKTKPREIVKGTLFTVAAWAAALAGFAV